MKKVENLIKITDREQLIDILTEQTEEANKYLNDRQLNKFKRMGIRNLKIGSVIGKTLIPFVVVSAITIPAFNAIGLGMPFIGGTQKEYSQIPYIYKSNGQIIEQESYNSKYINHRASVNVVSSWKLNENNKYERNTYHYLFRNNILNEETIKRLLQGDMEYLKELLGEPNVTAEFANMIAPEDNLNPNEYYITLEFTKDNEKIVLTKVGTIETVMVSILYILIMAVIVCIKASLSENLITKIKDIIDRYNPEMVTAISDIRQENLQLILRK